MPTEKPFDVRDIGDRIEMFVDEWLIEEKKNVSLKLNPPTKREVVLTRDEPWEDIWMCYVGVFHDEDRIRMYYRGNIGRGDDDRGQLTCCAESADGIRFTRPKLGLYEWQGSRDNNIVWEGVEGHNFAAFRDANPDANPEERYKAIGGSMSAKKGGSGLYALASPDGVRWKRMQEAPVMTDGAFDSQNIAFWDEAKGCYRCYARYFERTEQGRLRAIQSASSDDFIHWTGPEPNRYSPGLPREQFYTNATVPCPGAPHIYLSFPKRFVPSRKKVREHPNPGVSDAVFMSSRDGVHWDRTFREAWARPGLDRRNWTQRSNMTAWGILRLDPDEFSLYITEHYTWDDVRLRRLTVRRHGFASVHAGYEGGEFTTKPLTFAGSQLHLNYATSAAGSIQVEAQDEFGHPIAGCCLNEMPPLFGDELDKAVTWERRPYLTELAGKPVRFRFVMKDADLYALQVK